MSGGEAVVASKQCNSSHHETLYHRGLAGMRARWHWWTSDALKSKAVFLKRLFYISTSSRVKWHCKSTNRVSWQVINRQSHRSSINCALSVITAKPSVASFVRSSSIGSKMTFKANCLAYELSTNNAKWICLCRDLYFFCLNCPQLVFAAFWPQKDLWLRIHLHKKMQPQRISVLFTKWVLFECLSITVHCLYLEFSRTGFEPVCPHENSGFRATYQWVRNEKEPTESLNL